VDAPSEYTPVILESVPAAPEKPATPLGATARLEIIDVPSTQSVRLRWEPVAGAASYTIYRKLGKGAGEADHGAWIAETEAGNQVSYEDSFNLTAGDYVYTVFAKNGEESTESRSVSVRLPRSILLSDAQNLNPRATVGENLLQPGHPLGTDYLGRDLLSRLMAGARVSLFIGFFAPLLSVLLGMLIGGVSGFSGGRTDQVLMRFTDFVLALPFLLFVILFKIAFGAQPGQSGIFPMLVAMVLLSWTGPARLVRGQILQLRESEFVQAAKLLGAKPGYIIARHLLPNTLGVILVSLTFAIPTAIFTEAFLSFIGMGVVPPTPSWGGMCNEGIQRFLTVPHEFLFPAIFISVTVLAFNLLGDGLRDALDPRMRSTE
jgi:oligopeptide transport system permease protein